MSILTPFFNLIKPTKQEGVKVSDFNSNMDIIDTEMHKPPLTVNNIEPDPETRNIPVDVVPAAENLTSDEAQVNTGTFITRTSGGEASIKDGQAWMSDILGNMVRTGYVAESIIPTLSPDDGHLSVSIDRDTFVSLVSATITIVFSYSSSWSANPSTYGNDLSAYGITIDGTPENGDTLTVAYTKENMGMFVTATPTSFVSTGWNLYNHAVGYARVLNYGNDGFMIAGTYTSLAFSTSASGTNSEPISPIDGFFTVPSDGYVIVTGGNATDTEIWMRWSDWLEEPYEGTAQAGTFQAYTQSVIDLSGVMVNFPDGLMRVGNVFDEISPNTNKAYSRIEKMILTEQNLEDVIESGVAYEIDNNYIYAVRLFPVTYTISLDGEYTVSDHGLEMFVGTSVPLTGTFLYGNDLKGKLRRDVLTISQQDLNASQLAQIYANLGLGDAAKCAVLNALTATQSGYVLDARQGKVLKESILPEAYKIVSYSGNLNNLDYGAVYSASSAANNPTAHNYFVIAYTFSTSTAFQIALRGAGTTAFFRTKTNATWNAWKQFTLAT